MTNSEIIFRESCELFRAGIIAGSGIVATVTDGDGNEKQIELPEEIHTFSAWKQAGYIVKKGEKAIASFPIWKYTERRQNGGMQAQESTTATADNGNGDGDGNDDAQQNGRMFLKTAYFFRRSQVERITEDNVKSGGRQTRRQRITA